MNPIANIMVLAGIVTSIRKMVARFGRKKVILLFGYVAILLAIWLILDEWVNQPSPAPEVDPSYCAREFRPDREHIAKCEELTPTLKAALKQVQAIPLPPAKAGAR